MFRFRNIAFTIGLMTVPALGVLFAQAPPVAARPPRPTPPTRDPMAPGYVKLIFYSEKEILSASG